MKTTFLFFLFFFSSLNFAQTPIDSYFGSDKAVYDIVDSSTTLDQVNSGANLVWNFDSLVKIGQSDDTVSTPLTSELTSYPNSTKKVTINSLLFSTSATSSSEIFSSKIANVESITALKNNDLELNYKTNNAKLGTFPMNFGNTTTDATAGTYVYGMYLGTFTGTIVTSFDAYGTLVMNDIGNGIFNDTASRLKTVQNISLNYGVLTNVGTITQTTYSYFNTTLNSSNSLILRNVTTVVCVPLLGINQTVTQTERFNTMNLSVNEPTLVLKQIQITPNPAEDELHITSKEKIESVRISDSNGRLIINSNYTENFLNVSYLEKGIYFAAIKTNEGLIVKKFIKK